MMRARCARVHNQLLHAFSRSAWVALHVFDVQRAEDSCGWSHCCALFVVMFGAR